MCSLRKTHVFLCGKKKHHKGKVQTAEKCRRKYNTELRRVSICLETASNYKDLPI